MTSRKKQLQNFKLYAVTDITEYDSRYVRKIEQALCGGVDVIQLRSKKLSDAQLIDLGHRIRKIATKHHVLFFVNDRPDIARIVDADGVHLGQDDMPVDYARMILKSGQLVGKSTHSVQQVRRTVKENVDYIGFGPLFGTPTKPSYVPIGLADIQKVQTLSPVPVVCIGGIDESTIIQVRVAGGERVAVVRGLFNSANVKQAAMRLKAHLC